MRLPYYEWVLFGAFLSLLRVRFVAMETVLGVETDEFDFDGMPGAMHEFKFEVGAGKEECFYQKVAAGGKMHVSFEVLEGSDIRAYVRNPDGPRNNILDAQYDKQEGVLMVLRGGDLRLDFNIRKPGYIVPIQEARTRPRWITEFVPEEAGPYAICLDNTLSLMTSKLVYVYLVTYVQEEWDKYTQDLEEAHLTMSNFTALIQSVQSAIQTSMVHQAQGRMHVVKDWYTINRKDTTVFRWSLFQCIAIVTSACVQVVFVRRLFRTTKVTPSSKPRA